MGAVHKGRRHFFPAFWYPLPRYLQECAERTKNLERYLPLCQLSPIDWKMTSPFSNFTLPSIYALWSFFLMSKNPITGCYNASMNFLKLLMQIKGNYSYFWFFLSLFSFPLFFWTVANPSPLKKVTTSSLDDPIAN